MSKSYHPRKLIDAEGVSVMGIVNLNQDSFYANSRVGLNRLSDRVGRMIEAGADCIDLGAMSTRPGAPELSLSFELDVLTPAVDEVRRNFPEVIISVDTYRAKVVDALAPLGVDVINDISGGQFDLAMYDTVAKHGLTYVLMHTTGKPAVMQDMTHYDDLIMDLLSYFAVQTRKARAAGIHDIIIDPGIGFGKTVEQNFQILRCLSQFKILEFPILMGLSRKSFIYKTLGTTAAEALNGTTAMHSLAIINGAKILRVHDVAEAVECVRLCEAYRGGHN